MGLYSDTTDTAPHLGGDESFSLAHGEALGILSTLTWLLKWGLVYSHRTQAASKLCLVSAHGLLSLSSPWDSEQEHPRWRFPYFATPGRAGLSGHWIMGPGAVLTLASS